MLERSEPFPMLTARAVRWLARAAAVLWLLGAPPSLHAYGPAGHAIAGRAADALLCAPARDAIETLAGNGASLADIGQWADRIRSDPAYEHSSPWHYMNLPDGGSIAAYRAPPGGDVLLAIERFRGRLADRGLARRERLEALRFLTHFVADIHQPLHVGRASDRGGNTIDVVHDGETLNLHRFWDSAALDVGRGGVAGYADGLLPLARRLDAGFEPGAPEDWAAESLMLRPWVYSFDARAPALSEAYVVRAGAVSRMRLAQAAARLAATLNSIFCPSR